MSVSRRAFLSGAIALGSSQLLAGCQAVRGGDRLAVEVLSNAVPAPMLGEFRRASDRPVNLSFSTRSQLPALFDRLVAWRDADEEEAREGLRRWLPFGGSANVSELVLIGDGWLDKAIAEGLLQPLNAENWRNWETLPQQPIAWGDRVTQASPDATNPSSKNNATDDPQVWAAPYRWGSTVIAYRPDKFEELGWTPTDWSDLWHPDLAGRVALLDSPRQVIGLTLKKLGKSYNTADLAAVPELAAELAALHQQTRLYSSTAYQQPLMRGDVWAAVGYSRDLLAMTQYGREVRAVVPQSGTALWAEFWVRPQRAQATAVGDRWIDFCWQPRIAEQLSLLSLAASPAVLAGDRDRLPERLRTNPVLLPNPEILQRSEFIQLDLPESALTQYRELWQAVRRRTTESAGDRA